MAAYSQLITAIEESDIYSAYFIIHHMLSIPYLRKISFWVENM